MPGTFRTIRNAGDIESALRENDKQRQRDQQADVLVEMPRRLILRSPDGTYWQISVANDGTLVTDNLGSAVP
jgi:hypothetical protein